MKEEEANPTVFAPEESGEEDWIKDWINNILADRIIESTRM